MRICDIEGCNKKHYAKGLCEKHYKEQWRIDNPEYDKQYRKDHKEHYAELNKQYQQDNKEHIAELKKQYSEKNKNHFDEYRKQYWQTPAGKASSKAARHNRRTLLKGLTKAIIQRVYEANIVKYGQLTCCLCFKPIEFGNDSLEHLTPLTRQGTNDFNNLGIAHLNCNIRKHTQTLQEWFKTRQILLGK